MEKNTVTSQSLLKSGLMNLNNKFKNSYFWRPSQSLLKSGLMNQEV